MARAAAAGDPRLRCDGARRRALARSEGADFSAEALTNPNGFVGLDGIFRLRADGRVERALAVIEIHRAGDTVVSPEPQSFTGF